MSRVWPLMILIVVTLASFFAYCASGHQKYRHQLPAQPFFPNYTESWVYDFHSGQAIGETLESDQWTTITLYYAPWDRYSQIMRVPFQKVAKEIRTLHRTVRFVAINCFAAHGKCKQTYRMFAYPFIMAYVGRSSSVYMGEPEADHLYRWVDSLLHPVQLLTTQKDIDKFVQESYYPIIGYFPLIKSPINIRLRRFIAVANSIHTGQPARYDYQFAVISNQNLARVNQLSTGWPLVAQTKFEGPDCYSGNFTRKNIEEWALQLPGRDKTIRRVEFNKLYELSNRDFSTLLRKGPTLILFAENKALGENLLLNLFKQMVHEYHNCAIGQSTNVIMHIKASQGNVTGRCGVMSPNKALACCDFDGQQIDWKKICPVISSCQTDECLQNLLEAAPPLPETCLITHASDYVTIWKACCARATSMELDSKLPDRLYLDRASNLAMIDAQTCTSRRLTKQERYKIRPETPDIGYDLTFLSGRGCRHEEEEKDEPLLQFAILDAKQNVFFAKKWGIKGSPAIVGVDLKAEMFGAEENVNGTSLLKFTQDFIAENVNDYFLGEEKRGSGFSHKIPLPEREEAKQSMPVLLERLTKHTFHIATESNIDSVVYFSGGSWHGPSATQMHLMHSVSRIFLPAAEGMIRFYTIDASRNELPYNYNFEAYPAILIFSPNKTELSWKYPAEAKLDIEDITAFILSYCSDELRVKMAFELLDRTYTPRVLRRLKRHIHWLSSRNRSLREFSLLRTGPQHELFVFHERALIQKNILRLRAARGLLSILRNRVDFSSQNQEMGKIAKLLRELLNS
ncbi:unnamed protein product, partial [Mesorhabditis spiculigera]